MPLFALIVEESNHLIVFPTENPVPWEGIGFAVIVHLKKDAHRLLAISYGEDDPGARLMLASMDSMSRETHTTSCVLQDTYQDVE